MRARVWAAILLSSLGWGTGGVATRAALNQDVAPYLLVALRTMMAAVVVVVFLAVRKSDVWRSRRLWKLGVVQGVGNLAGPSVLLTLSLQYASAGFVVIVIALVPTVTALFAHFMLADEPMRLGMLAGLVVATGGVAVLVVSGDSGLDEGGRPLLAFALAAAAVTLIGFSSVYAKIRAASYNAIGLGGLQFVSGAVVLLLLTLAIEGMPDTVGGEAWSLITYLAIAATIMPFLVFFWTLQHATATLASLSGYLVPIIGVTAGIVLLDEQLQSGLIFGGFLILVGVMISDQVDRRAPQALAVPDPEPFR